MARRADLVTMPFTWLLKLATLIREALPVGILNRAQIQQMVDATYAREPDFYDPKTYRNDYERRLLPLLDRLAEGRRLLDLYCGHGREAEIFARAGYEVTGVEKLSAVAERARSYAGTSGFNAEFVNADIETWQPPHENWHVVYTSLWMYSTIPDRRERLNWLSRIAAWAAPGGVIVFSSTPGGDTTGARLRHLFARFFALVTLNPRRPEQGDRFHTGLFWHDLTHHQVTEDLRELGLDLVDSLSIAGGTPCDFYIARRRSG